MSSHIRRSQACPARTVAAARSRAQRAPTLLPALTPE
jgi:hypothetical protein